MREFERLHDLHQRLPDERSFIYNRLKLSRQELFGDNEQLHLFGKLKTLENTPEKSILDKVFELTFEYGCDIDLVHETLVKDHSGYQFACPNFGSFTKDVKTLLINALASKLESEKRSYFHNENFKSIFSLKRIKSLKIIPVNIKKY